MTLMVWPEGTEMQLTINNNNNNKNILKDLLVFWLLFFTSIMNSRVKKKYVFWVFYMKKGKFYYPNSKIIYWLAAVSI